MGYNAHEKKNLCKNQITTNEQTRAKSSRMRKLTFKFM